MLEALESRTLFTATVDYGSTFATTSDVLSTAAQAAVTVPPELGAADKQDQLSSFYINQLASDYNNADSLANSVQKKLDDVLGGADGGGRSRPAPVSDGSSDTYYDDDLQASQAQPPEGSQSVADAESDPEAAHADDAQESQPEEMTDEEPLGDSDAGVEDDAEADVDDLFVGEEEMPEVDAIFVGDELPDEGAAPADDDLETGDLAAPDAQEEDALVAVAVETEISDAA